MAPISLTFDLPAHIAEGLMSGEYIRNGGVIQNTAGRVVTWLRETPDSALSMTRMLSSIDPTGIAPLVVEAMNTAITQDRLGTIGTQVGHLQNQVSQLQNQVGQLNNLAVFSSATSLLTLGVTAIGFSVIYKRVEGIERELKATQEKLEEINYKVDLSFYSNFKAALDLARNAFTMQDVDNRRSSALQAIDRFLEAEHVYFDLSEQELKSKHKISHEYLLTLCLAFIAECRCYLELSEYETAISRFEEGKAKINQLIAKYLEMLLTPNPIIYLHPKLQDKIDLARLTRIYQWRDPGMTESAVFDQFRKSLGQTLTSNFWSDNVPKSIIGNDEIDNFFGITTDKGLTTIFSRLPQALEAMEMMIETTRRFESYEYEVKFLAKNNISFSKWSGISPKVENKDNSPLFFITHAEPMAV